MVGLPGHLDKALDAAASGVVTRLIKVESVPEPGFGMILRLLASADKELLPNF
jgi:hypothetical protein